MKKTILLLFILTLTSNELFAQDTTVYRQANESMFSNLYFFIRINKEDKLGRVIWEVGTDDLQKWYGKGTFKETRGHIYLTYDKLFDSTKIEMLNRKKANDTIYIKWYDINGPQTIFTILNIGIADSKNHDFDYFKTFIQPQDSVAKICRKDLKGTNLSLYVLSSKLVDFKIPSDSVDSIIIYYNNVKRIHEAKKTTQRLKKTKKGLITEGMWIKKKKTLFVLWRKQI